MQRKKATFPLSENDYNIIKQQMLNWASRFSICLFLDNNSYKSSYNNFECILGVEPLSMISDDTQDPLQKINEWHKVNKDWLFGHISYDFKNELENKLASDHPIKTRFSLINFFCPKIVCYINADKNSLTIESINVNPETVYEQIINCDPYIQANIPTLSFTKKIEHNNYIKIIEQLRRHIKDGDCYEINFCNEGFVENAFIDPLSVFNKLNKISPAPFAAFYCLKDQYLMCASPERYLTKKENKIISQPIKGTAKRNADTDKDEIAKQQLSNSIKDKAENVMIVDLVRNDLARSCEVNSVKVEELFGIYSFPQVHQMISTISGKLKENIPFTDAIRYSFPMGSMTGAPKIKVMQLIEQYEYSRRELFAGTVGYITPEADFDLNVVIRSMFYNASTKYLNYQTGGAITYDSNAQQEWEEMELKAWAMEQIFKKNNGSVLPCA